MFRAAFAGILFLLACLAAAEAPHVAAHRMAKAPVIDGRIDEIDEWKEAATFGGLLDSNIGSPAPDTAMYWLGYDATYIYFAVRAFDRQPSSIRAQEYRTNVSLVGEDYIELDVDLSNSLGEFNRFQFNALGATNLLLAGGRAAKREWTGEFVAKGRITGKGYEIEARVPWKLMQLPARGKRDARFNIGRFVSRTNLNYTYGFTNNGHAADTPVWSGVEIPPQPVDRTLNLLPYLYAGYDPDQGRIANLGLDMKKAITDQIQFVGSINPDFRNIENQILSLDFSRFARLTAETRPFFLEGSDFVGNQLLATQQIADFDVGASTYGKLTDRTNFGVLDALSFNSRSSVGRYVDGNFDDVPDNGRRNNLAATVTHQIDPSTSLRASMTSVKTPNLDNSAYLVRLSKDIGPWNVFLRDMESQDSRIGFGRDLETDLNYAAKGLFAFGSYTSREPHFQPALGFFPETNYRGATYGAGYNRSYAKGGLNDWGTFQQYFILNRETGGPYHRQYYGNLYGTWRPYNVAVNLDSSREQFLGIDDHLDGLSICAPRGDPYKGVSASYHWGVQGGLKYESRNATLLYKFWKRMQLGGTFQEVWYAGARTDQVIVTGNYDMGHERSVSGRIVRQGNDLNGYLSFRRSGNLGTEYFLIVGNPNALTFRPSVILKVTVPISLFG